MELKTLKVKPRGLATKGQLNKIRKNGGIPAVYYGKNQEPVHFEVAASDFRLAWGPGNRNSLLNLEVEGQTGEVAALVYDVQKDPISGAVQHIDFIHVSPGERVKVKVPVRLNGTPVGVKTEGGQLFQLTKRIVLSALPEHIPSHFDLDVSAYHSEHVHYVRDLDLGDYKLASSPKAVLFYIQKGRVKK
jgi:large subunit ribosomal protein L25